MIALKDNAIKENTFMPNKKPTTTDHTNQEKLRQQIQTAQAELEEIQTKIRTFEAVLYTHLSDLLIEEQELFILYKQIKKAKKEKRLEQKKRGKNYKEPKGLQIIREKRKNDIPSEQQAEKKRLYREAILQVHPDKFSMNKKESEAATEITRRLIEIYKTGTLAELQAYHTHIFKGNTSIKLDEVTVKVKILPQDNYLQQEKDRIKKAITLAKKHQLYKVITEYKDPLIFMKELKDYYEDRILKLKKRTRKGL